MPDKIYLQDIIPLEELKKEGPVLLVRHYHDNLSEMVEKEIIEKYQSFQGRSGFRDFKYMISFLAEPNNQAKLYGVYENQGQKEKADLPAYSYELEQYCIPQDREKDFFLILEKRNEFKKFENRLIIDWVVPRGWYNRYGDVKNKEVIRILPYNYVSEFPGLMKIKITANELRTIISNPETHSKWYESLTRLQAIYLILDKRTGNQYVGTTYGENGLWQRWETYAKGDFTGGNKELLELKKQDEFFFRNFQYSVLEILSKNASKNECIEAESLWKEKLGTRTFGLNQN